MEKVKAANIKNNADRAQERDEALKKLEGAPENFGRPTDKAPQ